MAQTNVSFLSSRIVQISLGIIIAFFIAILILPQIISTNFVSGKIKSIINEKAPGTLNYNSLELSWFQGVHIHKIDYQDNLQGVHVTVDEISSTKGLLALATNYKDGGLINISRPHVKLITEQPKESAKQNDTTQSPEKSDTPKKEKTDTQQSRKDLEPFQIPVLPPINVQVNLTDGTITTINSDQTETPVIEDIGLNLALDGLAGTLDYQLSLKNSQADGTVSGKGNIQLPQEAEHDINALQSNANVQILDWQIAKILDVASARTNSPHGEGVINGSLQLTGKGVSELALTGEITGRNIKLHGGVLQTDTPSIDNVSLNLGVTATQKSIELEHFDLKSPFASANLTARATDSILQTLTTTAKVDVAAILMQLPATLQLKEGMKLSEGVVDIDATVNTVEQNIQFQAKTFLQRLAGTAAGKNISLNQPIDLSVIGTSSNNFVTIENFDIQSSLLTAKGSGDINGMQLVIATDIGNALKEVEKFIDLGGLNSDGKLNLAVEVGGDTEDVKELKGNLQVDGFELVKDGKTISPKDTFIVDFKSKLLLKKGAALKEMRNSTIDFSSWFGKGTFTSESITPPDDTSPGKIVHGNIDSDVDLERLTTLLHSLNLLPAEQTLSGPLKLKTTLEGENLEKPLFTVSMNAQPFTFSNSEKTFSDDNVSLKIEADADLTQKSYSLKHFSLSSKPVSFSSKGTLHTDNKEQKLSTTGTSNINLAALSQQLQSYADLQLEMSGTSEKPFTLKSSTKDGVWQDTPQRTDFETSFHADTIVGYGLNIESLDLPIQLKQSIAEIDFKAKVNSGLMTIKPKVDFSGKYPVASLPDNSTILKDVGLTGDMSNDLLAKIHPLFKGVSTTAGTINLDMEHMNWPAGEEQIKDVTFGGSFVFKDVKLQAGALLTPLLALMKTDENSIVLSDTPMTFVGKDKRVTCSPLEVMVNEYSLILEGSVGFDQTLDYVAKIPVTRKMVSSKIYKYLEGTYIKVPITGTASKPTISKSIVQNTLGDLVLQAGKKQLNEQAGKLLKNLFK